MKGKLWAISKPYHVPTADELYDSVLHCPAEAHSDLGAKEQLQGKQENPDWDASRRQNYGHGKWSSFLQEALLRRGRAMTEDQAGAMLTVAG